MPASDSAVRAIASHSRANLVWGVSLAALVTALGAGQGRAQSVGALMAASHQATAAVAAVTASAVAAPTAAPGTSAGMAAASARALQNQTQVNQALTLAQQAQAAGRAAALAASSTVPNGLGAGALNPVADPVSAAKDPSGLNTWQGASLPTASATNPDNVTVVQTDPSAILSWQTFNIGLATTLTFQQQKSGVNQPTWIVLNRVVGQLDPSTGMRDPSLAPAPSQILGAINAPGTVLVLNANGILFGGASQVNVGSLVATSLEIGHALENGQPISIAQRDTEFLNFGLLGYAEQQSGAGGFFDTFSAQAISGSQYEANPEGAVQIDAGASLTSATNGFLMFFAPQVANAGTLTSPSGEVALQSGRHIQLTASEGTSNSVDPDVRGLVVTANAFKGDAPDYVDNLSGSIISVPMGYVSIGATTQGAVIDGGFISSTTSVSENGYVNLFGGSIAIDPDTVISIAPDSSATTIPQDPTSLADFKTSKVRIGDSGALIDIGANSLIYAPSATIDIGADRGPSLLPSLTQTETTRVFIDTGAVIDAAGLTDVVVPASRNAIKIDPVKGNELADSPAFRNGFLNGATVYLDPRLSGVNADGVAWVGSPLIAAAAYAQQVGVTVSELMTSGGNVTLGVQAYAPGSKISQAPDVIVKSGASIDISGGWKTYQAGNVQESQLITTDGEVIPISQANLDDTYLGLYTGYTVDQARWGLARTYVDPLLTGTHYDAAYTEGVDAGSLTIKGSTIALDGQVFAAAFAGPQQIVNATPGTASGSVPGDLRRLQGAPSQLPAGGFLSIQALGLDSGLNQLGGGGDISIVGGADYQPVSTDLSYGQTPTIAANGSLLLPSRPASSVLPVDRQQTISLNADALSQIGLSEISLQTSGQITVSQDAAVQLAPGGAFEALAGRAITIDGAISVPAGSIDLNTQFLSGSVFVTELIQPGAFDVTVNGALSVAGRWANDFNASANNLVGSAFLNGGEITLAAAPRVSTSAGFDDPMGVQPPVPVDSSGSILINDGALLDASGGGYVAPNGAVTTTAKGGNVSLFDDTTYFQLTNNAAAPIAGGLPGFRVFGVLVDNSAVVSSNPSTINAHVSIADGSIRANGFGGGGTFTLSAAGFSIGPSETTSGAALPLDFFSQAGFANYKISSYGTDLVPNAFDNGLGGYNAVLATQVVNVGAGQTLSLNQAIFSPQLDTAQLGALQNLATGSSLYAVLSPTVPTDAWDQRAVNLTLGGLLELHVDAGGQVTGAPGASLTVGQLYNEGTIRIAGGSLTQSEVLPLFYGGDITIGVHALSDVFSTAPDGTIMSNAPNAMGLTQGGPVLTNSQVAALYPIYLLGDLNAGEGVRLAPGSVTDLSGAAIVNPRAAPEGDLSATDFTDGKVLNGGVLASTDVYLNTGSLFHQTLGGSVYSNLPTTGTGVADALNAATGSLINLSGAQAVFDRPTIPDAPPTGNPAASYAPTLEWSNGGTLDLGSGGTISGATILAQGGAPLALGGTFDELRPVLYQHDPATPTVNAISADAVTAAGFSTFIAEGGLTSVGDVTLTLPRSVFVETPTNYAITGTAQAIADANAPVLGSGGRLEIDAPYIGLDGAFQTVSTPLVGAPANNSLILQATDIDITGAVVFDQSVGQATLSASEAVRLIGVAPSTIGLQGPAPATLDGQLATNGDITFQTGQVFPTTGTSFSITSAAANGMIRFASEGGTAPTAPYSAGGSLFVQAAQIDQAGVVRVPLGSLTLGSNAASPFAPATDKVTLEAGGITSVSADGLNIPYGTTTDQVEWYFTPTNSNPLTAPPAAVLHLAGATISTQSGANVDLSGGGDVYAYEFVPGTGGTRDVLDQYNPDEFSSNNGYQYPDGRQIYAIVPGLSGAAVAAYDPIYSSGYSAIYGPSQAGLSVYLNSAPGLTAGWYTLLPAKYALLPGGMRVVQDTSAVTPPPVNGVTMSDGTIVTSGRFGVAGVNTETSNLLVFDVQSQAVFRTESKIDLTQGDTTFAADAAHNGVPVPRLPIDAGQLILSPISGLEIDAAFDTTPAPGGRGSEVDISGQSLTIEPAGFTAAPAGTIVLTDTSLSNLDAASLFLGGARTDNADGTTSLDVTTNLITVAAGAHLTEPELILATDGPGANLTVASGASIVATGSVTGETSGDYVIDGAATGSSQDAQGAFLRVSNGPERLLTRLNVNKKVKAGVLNLGSSDIEGNAVELLSYGNFKLGKTPPTIEAGYLALGASHINFGTGGGLLITPSLQAQFSQAKSLTLQSPNTIGFAPGVYEFGNLDLDAPGVTVKRNGSVTLDTGILTLQDSSTAKKACTLKGAFACGTGMLLVNATEADFRSGTLRTYGAGGGVTLNAANGVFADGAATFDVGAANLVIGAPFVGDRGSGTAGATTPSLTLTTTGDVTITNPTPLVAIAAPAGTPGSDLIIDGNTVTVNGSELRATAGTLQITAAQGIALNSLTATNAQGATVVTGALLATPGYAKTFGDSADPTTVSAPGGLLSLTTDAGAITISDESRLSIGGGAGQAGTLQLVAQQGGVIVPNDSQGQPVALGSVIEASAPGGGASLNLDTNSAFDLSAFAEGVGTLFNGSIAVRTATGDLTLGSKDSLTATSVQLVADGGQIDDSGLINTSGVNGGNVTLYGADGVHLESTATIKAQAQGYADTDTRQATGGSVTLGVDGAGAINIDSGAVIDISALRTGNRLVQLPRSNGTYYSYVAGDTGGSVTFRAPVVSDGGADTVRVTVAGSVVGASSVVLEGFQRWNLATVAADPAYDGVEIVGGQAELNVAAANAGTVNFLGADGPVAQFIQTFDVSADYGALGGLAGQANFHAQPGVELDYSGGVVLQSNWNLGAGVVNVAAAAAAGLMVQDPGLPGRYEVVSGDEGQILADYTQAIYRVGGTFYGEPGILSVRAGGALDLQGSITDGFFQFGDQTDPQYLNYALGGGNRVYQGSLTPTCTTADCSGIQAWSPGVTAANYLAIDFPGAHALGTDPFNNPLPPYSAVANSPAAQGSLAGGTGDPLGSAVLFPLIPSKTSSGPQAITSWSYQLVAGADLTGAGGNPSANPLETVAGSAMTVTVEGQHVYGYKGTAGTTSYSDGLGLQDSNGVTLAAQDWAAAFLAENPTLQDDSYTTIDWATAPLNAKSAIADLAKTYFDIDHPGAGQIKGAKVTTTLSSAAQFLAYVSANFGSIAPYYKAPVEKVATSETYAVAPTLVRTGTGSIEMAASGDINLQNGAKPTVLTTTGALKPATSGDAQLGGAAVYTAGAVAQLGAVTATDFATGATYSVDLATNAVTSDIFDTNPQNTYTYGGGLSSIRTGYTGILIANPVYADGGGDVSLDAGVDVLGRRDVFQENRLGGVGPAPTLAQRFGWIGGGDQPWRTGTIGSTVNAQVNPQLFEEGVGTLGGGNISVHAGRNVSDISIVATDSLTTGQATAGASGGTSGSALVTLGGGNVDVVAGANVLGGRLDVASGAANVTAYGNIVSAGQYSETLNFIKYSVDNTLRVRLSDATVSLVAGGAVSLQGVTALGVQGGNLSTMGLYSQTAGISILADSSVNIANNGADVVTPAQANAEFTASAVYPGSFEAVSLTSGLDVSTIGKTPGQASEAVLYPTPTGTLTLLADGNIAPLTIAQLDTDPTLLPGAFSSFTSSPSLGVTSGVSFVFPAVLPDTTDVTLRAQHNPNPTHAGDDVPDRIDAGGDLIDVIVSTAKQTRIAAGQDIINMVFEGQNLSADDITRITAGRDITATTTLAAAYNAKGTGISATDLPVVQGNTFILGGPGALFIEAGRDAGPFLNSAVTDGSARVGANQNDPTGVLTYGGGIITVGNLWNPWLPAQSADIFTEFGVAKGQDFAALVDTYLSPANFANLPAYEFLQTTDTDGNQVPDRNEQVYSLSLVQWIESIAPTLVSSYEAANGGSASPANRPSLIAFMQNVVAGKPLSYAQALAVLPQLSDRTMPLIPWLTLNFGDALNAAFGTQNITYQQAFDLFQTLPQLTQREFLIKDVYFNELIQTSIPTSPSYLKYSRGYQAVNTLFPSSLGYTANSLSGGPAGASTTVETGNLDLRLGTIQTEQGGDVEILGPGGRVLAGSTVSTSVQASRRNYIGGALYSGGLLLAPLTASITQIPAGYEGVLTLDGGDIESFTDGDFLLNQSRAFTEAGGDVALWSSNADVNAGQGPRTTGTVPPVQVLIDENGYSTINTTGAVSGAGIGAFAPDDTALAPSVYLIAPRGTVDAGDAGVRSSGNVFIAAYAVANANAISAQGTISGVQTTGAVNVGAQSSGNAANAAAAQAAAAVSGSQNQDQRPLIVVDVLGYISGDLDECQPEEKARGVCE